ncbi:MAG: outer membrane beta-barrel protein [Gammaproteobacteria bacterium]|nr:outer membrane beta-barrel protein [Gammaproteobacteria bacterium]
MTGLLIYSSTGLAAQTQQAEWLFNQGINAFNEQDYQAALGYFQQAQQLGLTNKRLPYNLGVTLYKLSDYGAAYDALKGATSDNDLAAIAYFNMGLAALKMAKTDLANDNFQQSYSHANNNEQRQLAQRMLEKLSGSNNSTSRHTPTVSLSGGLGYNDNVTLNATDDDLVRKSEQGDSYYTLYTKLNQPFSASLFSDVTLYTLQYINLNDYNYTALDADINYKIPIAAAYLTISAKAQSLFLDNNLFQNLQLAQLDVNYNISSVSTVAARYQFSNIDATASPYDHLAGNRQRLRVFGKYFHRKDTMQWFYEYETNNREGNRIDNTRDKRFSPRRNKLGFKYNRRLNPAFNFQGGWQYRRSDFSDINQTTRKDTRTHANLRLIYRLSKQLWIYADYRYLDNKSNNADYNYQSNRISLNLYWN